MSFFIIIIMMEKLITIHRKEKYVKALLVSITTLCELLDLILRSLIQLV